MFYLKNITMPEFLSAQIANRIKIDFRSEKELSEKFDYKSVEGKFISEKGKNYVLIKFKILDKFAGDDVTKPRIEKVEKIVEIASAVVYGYKFKDFDFMEMEDQYENVRLRVGEKDLYTYNKKKMPIEEIVRAPAGYF